MRNRYVFLLAALVAFQAWAQTPSTGSGQTFPNRPIRLVTGYPPGGSADFLSRIAADELTKELGVTVIVDNRPGAGGNIAAELVARANADGYTILNATDLAVNTALYKNPGYGEKDFTGVTRVARGPNLIVVTRDAPFKSLKDVIDFAKAKPGKLLNAAGGFGSSPHLASVLFASVAGVKFTTVHYKGGGPAIQSLLAGETQITFATAPTVMGLVRSGRVRALAVSTPLASPAVPGVPGAQEAGLPGYNYAFSYGLYVPAATPRNIVRRLHAASFKVLSKPEVRERIGSQAMEAAPSASPEAFMKEVQAQVPYWQKLVRDSGAKIE